MMHGNKLSHLLPLRVKKKNLQISKNIIIIKKKKKKKKAGNYKFCYKMASGKTKQARFSIRLTVGEIEEITDGAKSGDFANLKEKVKKLDNKC